VHIARNKALAVKEIVPSGRIIVAADTVVVLDKEIIGKPRDREDAIGILSRLAGNQHEVITGVVLVRGEEEVAFADSTAVWFHELTEQQIANYVDKYKPYDKAGAYAIQEWIGVVGIKGIQGDFYNVMGLPVSRVVRELLRMQGRGIVK
jgi:septum formation protein